MIFFYVLLNSAKTTIIIIFIKYQDKIVVKKQMIYFKILNVLVIYKLYKYLD